MEIYNAFEIKAMMPQNINYTAEEVIASDIMPRLVQAAKFDRYKYVFNFRDFNHNYRVPIEDIIKELKRHSFIVEPLYYGCDSIQAIRIKWDVSSETKVV